MAGLFGGFLYGAQPAGSLVLLLVSGGVIVADDLYKYGIDWLRFVQGWAVLLKMVLLIIALVLPSLAVPGLVAAIIVGGVVSHAPGKVRQAALWGTPGPCARRDGAPVGAGSLQ